ncbi:MAG: polynucleotide adenylyltransferase PcnB [Spirochaetales bacterium]
MLARYTKDSRGNPVKSADIYTKEEHGLKLEQIDPDALFITRKLRSAGFEAYVVGGAVRDLLLGRKPKDFDIATDAHPRAIKKVLPFSRIIGKRFRLVHVYFAQNKIIEVATFRSNVEGDNNVFGTLEEDAKRRDFTFNTLFYDPKDQYIVDLTGGVKDIRSKRLQNVIPLEVIFDEDPVRMIRAAKYATTSGFRIPGNIQAQIRRKAPLLLAISPARLTEEFYKVLFSGNSQPIFSAMEKLKVLDAFVPQLALALHRGLFGPQSPVMAQALALLDAEVKAGKEPDRSAAVSFLVAPLLEAQGWQNRATLENFDQILQELKDWFKPIIPSNQELETALRTLYRVWAVRAPRKRPPRQRHRRGGGTSSGVHHKPEGPAL